jgi:hypothetical protein
MSFQQPDKKIRLEDLKEVLSNFLSDNILEAISVNEEEKDEE